MPIDHICLDFWNQQCVTCGTHIINRLLNQHDPYFTQLNK